MKLMALRANHSTLFCALPAAIAGEMVEQRDTRRDIPPVFRAYEMPANTILSDSNCVSSVYKPKIAFDPALFILISIAITDKIIRHYHKGTSMHSGSTGCLHPCSG